MTERDCCSVDWTSQRLKCGIFHLLIFSAGKSQFSPQSCLTLQTQGHCSMPGFPVHHQLPKLAQTHVHQIGDAIKPSHPLSSPSPPAFNLFQHQCLFWRVNSLYQSGGQTIGVSASVSVLPMNIQDLFPLGWTGWISLLSRDSQ